jgi:hypothetical protein
MLATTDALKNLLGSMRRVSLNVKRWRAVGFLEAEKILRRVRDYRGMSRFLAILREHDARLDGDLASCKEVA